MAVSIEAGGNAGQRIPYCGGCSYDGQLTFIEAGGDAEHRTRIAGASHADSRLWLQCSAGGLGWRDVASPSGDRKGHDCSMLRHTAYEHHALAHLGGPGEF